MMPKQKKAKIQQVINNKALQRDSPTKDSIAMENPAYISTDMPPKLTTSKFQEDQIDHFTTGERQSEEDITIMERTNCDKEPRKQTSIIENGNNPYKLIYYKILIQYIIVHTTPIFELTAFFCRHQLFHMSH